MRYVYLSFLSFLLRPYLFLFLPSSSIQLRLFCCADFYHGYGPRPRPRRYYAFIARLLRMYVRVFMLIILVRLV